MLFYPKFEELVALRSLVPGGGCFGVMVELMKVSWLPLPREALRAPLSYSTLGLVTDHTYR